MRGNAREYLGNNSDLKSLPWVLSQAVTARYSRSSLHLGGDITFPILRTQKAEFLGADPKREPALCGVSTGTERSQVGNKERAFRAQGSASVGGPFPPTLNIQGHPIPALPSSRSIPGVGSSAPGAQSHPHPSGRPPPGWEVSALPKPKWDVPPPVARHSRLLEFLFHASSLGDNFFYLGGSPRTLSTPSAQR